MNRIEPGSYIPNILEKYPCLKKVMIGDSKTSFSAVKINEIMGKDFVNFAEGVTAYKMNMVLDKLLGE